MKDVLVLGAGRQGRFVARQLVRLGLSVLAADVSRDSLDRLPPGVEAVRVEGGGIPVEGYKLAVECLPAAVGLSAMEWLVLAGKPCVSISYTPEAPGGLDPVARSRGVFVVPDMGLAPGMSNFYAGYCYALLGGSADAVVIKVGGIPAEPCPPFNYFVTWSPSDLLDEYLRPARVRRQGQLVTVPAVSDVRAERVCGHDGLESFVTDGLRSLLHTLPDVPHMEERTVRWAGHATILQSLRQIGLFDEAPLAAAGGTSPRPILEGLLARLPGGRDRVLMEVEVTRKGRRLAVTLVDEGDGDESAMARTTGTPPAIVASLLLERGLAPRGVVYPELLGMDPAFAEAFTERARELGLDLHREG